MNEGLEKLGDFAFCKSTIESITFPSTLRKIDAETFYYCENLKRVEIPNGVEYIGRECFRISGIEEITFPSTLKEIEGQLFDCCWKPKTVWVEEGCALDIRKYVDDHTVVFPAGLMAGARSLRDLRELKDVVIPDGLQEIGE